MSFIFAARSWWDTYSHVLAASGPLPCPFGTAFSWSSKEREKKNYEGTEEPSLGGTSAEALGSFERWFRVSQPAAWSGQDASTEGEPWTAVEIRCQPSRPLLIGATHPV